jgi:hypothetical protein
LGNYDTPFKAGRGVTQGGPLLAKLFNIMVDAVVREWLRILREELDMEGEELDSTMEALFNIFYVDDAYITARDPIFLQQATDWNACTVTCRECGKDMQASSLGCHLADMHKIYQQQVVAQELLEGWEGVTYKVALGYGKLRCPFPLSKGELASGWMMWRHFRDVHPLDYVVVAKEGRYP